MSSKSRPNVIFNSKGRCSRNFQTKIIIFAMIFWFVGSMSGARSDQKTIQKSSPQCSAFWHRHFWRYWWIWEASCGRHPSKHESTRIITHHHESSTQSASSSACAIPASYGATECVIIAVSIDIDIGTNISIRMRHPRLG